MGKQAFLPTPTDAMLRRWRCARKVQKGNQQAYPYRVLTTNNQLRSWAHANLVRLEHRSLVVLRPDLLVGIAENGSESEFA